MRAGASTRSALALAELCYRTLLPDGVMLAQLSRTGPLTAPILGQGHRRRESPLLRNSPPWPRSGWRKPKPVELDVILESSHPFRCSPPQSQALAFRRGWFTVYGLAFGGAPRGDPIEQFTRDTVRVLRHHGHCGCRTPSIAGPAAKLPLLPWIEIH